MKHIVTALLLVAVALAGCSGGGDGDGQPTTTTMTSTMSRTVTTTSTVTTGSGPGIDRINLLLDFGLLSCQGASVGALVPVEDMQALLPEGFTAATVDDPAPTDLAVAIVDLYRCANFTTPSVFLPETWFGHAHTLVEDPGLGHDADRHEYMFSVLAQEDVLAQLWTVAGYNVSSGMPGIEDTDPTGDAAGQTTVASRRVAVAGYDLTAGGLGLMPTTYGPETFVRYTALGDGGMLVWTGTWTVPTIHEGLGTLTVPADSVFADLALLPAGDPFGFAYAVDDATFEGQDLLRMLPDAT